MAPIGVEVQPIVVAAPGCADLCLLLEEHERDPGATQAGSYGEPGRASSYDHHLRLDVARRHGLLRLRPRWLLAGAVGGATLG